MAQAESVVAIDQKPEVSTPLSHPLPTRAAQLPTADRAGHRKLRIGLMLVRSTSETKESSLSSSAVLPRLPSLAMTQNLVDVSKAWNLTFSAI
jgi:hypothetical protein